MKSHFQNLTSAVTWGEYLLLPPRSANHELAHVSAVLWPPLTGKKRKKKGW
jgi:hypothetical protein